MQNTTGRYLAKFIDEDLSEKMVFIGGPRQVGKTTLAKNYLDSNNNGYFNWDDLEDRDLILKNRINKKQPLLVFDEIHKYRNWRGLVKGIFDKYHEGTKIIVTGSARLDHFRKGGDSLVGRYHYYRLHPFTLPEISTFASLNDIKYLLEYGGFPEPFMKGNHRHWSRWQNERISRVVTQDLRDLETVKEISLVELLVSILPSKVGSLLSLKSLTEDLSVSHHTVERWITILENLYLCFRIAPFGNERIKAVKKAQKLYFWDWSQVENMGSRFENLMASHLLKYCHFHEDYNGSKMELRYIRDVEGREIDFLVLKNKKPLFAVECKTGESHKSKHLEYFKNRLNIPKIFQTHLGTNDYGNEVKDGRVLPFPKLCQELELL
jgi:predicted AAA+ superfamily ATPase